MKHKIFKGKLEFMSWHLPIRLFTETGEIDLRDYYFPFFKEMNCEYITMEDSMNSISIFEDPDSIRRIEYNDSKDKFIILLKDNNGGFSNLASYIGNMFMKLNGRNVVVKFIENGIISISNDPEEKVFGVYYTDFNSCHVSHDDAIEVCRIGTANACVFSALGSDGFSCMKFSSSMARLILDRLSKKQMNCTRIGDCAVLGRKDAITQET